MFPSSIPPLEVMLDDIGYLSHAKRAKLAKALDVSERTLSRWLAGERAPRTALLAIFWITQWGQNTVHCQAHNDAVMYAGYVGALKDEVAKLQAQLERVGRIGDFGSANDPAPGVRSAPAVSAGLVFPVIQFPDDASLEPPKKPAQPIAEKPVEPSNHAGSSVVQPRERAR